MQTNSSIAAVALMLVLGGCATPTAYQPLVPERGGYFEERLSQNQFRVVFVGNARTRPEQVENYLLRRAAELTLEQGYDWFRPTNKAVEGKVRVIQTSRGPVRVSQGRGYSKWGDYGSFYSRSGLGLLKPLWRRINPPSGEAVEASAEIVLGRKPVPLEQGVFDARLLLQQRRP